MRSALILLIVALVVACGGSDALDSGIRGRALVPMCGAPFPTCTSPPLPNAEFNVRQTYAGPVVRTVRAGPDGRFEIRLRPGSYVLEAENGLPLLKAMTVVVEPHRFTQVRLGFDSGIR